MRKFLFAGAAFAIGGLLGGSVVDFLLIAVVVVISMVLHELAHGYVALWNGDYTAKVNGRLTLNPLAHFDLIGFLMLMTVGFGYAKPVPVNPFNFKHQKKGIFTVAIAGVTTNLILAVVSSLLGTVMLSLMLHFPGGEKVYYFFYTFFSFMTTINLSLIFFNIIPIYPLDGFRVVEAFTRYNNRFAKFLRDYGQYILIALIGISIIVGFVVSYANVPDWLTYVDVLGTYIHTCVNGVSNFLSWLWSLFIPL